MSHAATQRDELIRVGLGVLVEQGATHELRVPKPTGRRGVASGYFDDAEALADAAAEWDGRAEGVFVSLNPVQPETTSGVLNCVAPAAKRTTGDAAISRRRWLLLDFDPTRPAGTSSANTEWRAALDRACACYAWLTDEWGFPVDSLVLANSGNGAHLLIRVDLPNDRESHDLVRRCLEAVALRFGDQAVKVDLSVGNAARITKAYGTLTMKGEATAEHRHQRSFLAALPLSGEVTPAPHDRLLKLAGTVPPPPAAGALQPAPFDVENWIAEHELRVARSGDWTGAGGRGRKWVLAVCPFNPAHTNLSAVILEHASGAVSFRCLHDGCSGHDWFTLRDRLEPGWQAPSGVDAEPQSDLGSAQRLVRLYGARIRYVPRWRTWLVYDGTRWLRDDTGEVTRLAQQTTESALAEAVAFKGDREDRLKRINFALRQQDDYRIRAMVSQAQALVPARPEDFDRDPFTINCANGALNLHTSQLRPHAPEEMLSKLAPVPYEPRAACPRWHAFLDRIFGGNANLIEYVQRALGAALVGVMQEQCFHVLHGSGANGKSTLMEIVRTVLGDYAKHVASSSLLSRRGVEGIRSDLARLRDARIVTASETNRGGALDEATIKALSGGDTITARQLYQAEEEFRAACHLIVCTNHKPRIKGADHAIWRRVRMVPFGVTIPAAEQDRNLREKLLAELPGVLAWLVEGALAVQRDGGRLAPPPEVVEAGDKYRREMDAIGRFLGERCETGTSFTVGAQDLYHAYSLWCGETCTTPVNRSVFKASLLERGHEQRRTEDGIFWLGFRLVSEESTDTEDVEMQVL